MKSVARVVHRATLAAGVFLLSTRAAFAVTLDEMGRNVGNQFQGLAFGLRMGAIFLGFLLVIVGLYKFTQAQKSKEGFGPSIVMILVGIALMGVMVVIQMGEQSLFGTSDASNAAGQLGLTQ